MYELLLRRGQPEELNDWIDGALLVDLWDELKIPQVVRLAWDPVVDPAGNGPVERPGTALPLRRRDATTLSDIHQDLGRDCRNTARLRKWS